MHLQGQNELACRYAHSDTLGQAKPATLQQQV
jgi:hypothetical protein